MTVSKGKEKLRILQVHNRYAPGWGGEETVVDLEAKLLEQRGHAVERFQVSSAFLKNASPFHQMLVAPRFLWSRKSYHELRVVIEHFDPDVVHVHNTFPLLSPSVFWATRAEGVPVVQTLHNFRHTCANALLLRDEKPCEDCVGRAPWSALRYKCYADSFIRTALVVAMNALHWNIGTYKKRVDAFIALNSFSRDIFERSGLPGERLFIKANFIPSCNLSDQERLRQLVFVGAMTKNKGLHLLLKAWETAAMDDGHLLLIGDGPERADLQREFSHLTAVSWAGRLEHSEVLSHLRKSCALVLPSFAYENCPMVLLEAFSMATPVIVPDYPSMKTMVRHEKEGLLYSAADPLALASALRTMLKATSNNWSNWSRGARSAHAELYSEDVNYNVLISIYQNVIDKSLKRSAKEKACQSTTSVSMSNSLHSTSD